MNNATLGSVTFSDGGFFSYDNTTAPCYAQKFADSVNAAGGNVTMILDPYAVHGYYSEDAMATAVNAFMAIA